MTIKVTYNVTDVYVTQDVSPVYINVSYSGGGSGGAAVWGGITGTLSDQTDLQTALDGKFDDPTGTTSQYLRGDGTLATFPAIPSGTVTSVGLTMPSAFSVANSPVTSSGTLAVTGAGTSAQYIRGDGQLANFPDNQGGGSSVNYYLNGSVTQGTFGGVTYYEMSKTPVLGAGTNFTRTNAQGNGYIASFITDAGDPSLLNIPGGNWNLEFYFQANSNAGNPQFYAELYKVDASNNFTLIGSGSTNPEGITNGTTVDEYYTSIPVPQTSLLVTDRLAVRIYVITSGRTITLHTENSNLCEILTTFSTGLNALNGLTAQVQYFATGTSGTDFAISSATDTHTFNLPTASSINRGALSSADWTTFNNKISGSGAAGQVAYWDGTTSQAGSTDLQWNGTNLLLGNDKGLVFQTAGTNKSTRILPNNVVDNFASVTFYPNSGTNVGQSFNVIPRGTGLNSALKAQFFVFNSDFVADQTNWEGMLFRAAGTSFTLATGKAGTGTIRPLLLSAGFADGVTNANQLWLYTNGNVGINTTTNGSERLQVQGTTLLNGNTSVIGLLFTSTSPNRPWIGAVNGFASPTSDGTALQINIDNSSGRTATGFDFLIRSGTRDYTSGSVDVVRLTANYTPTSGTGVFSNFVINPTINQTGGANGITRGLYILPTLTAAADFRAIETSAGNVLFGSGFFWDNANSRLGIGTATPSGIWSGNNRSIQILAPANFASELVLSRPAGSFGAASVTHFLSGGGVDLFGIYTASTTSNYAVYTNSNERLRIWTTGNVSIGAGNNPSDSGERLQVTGDVKITGSGATSGTNALTVRNSSNAVLLQVRNNGNVDIGAGNQGINTPLLNITGSFAYLICTPAAGYSAVFGTYSSFIASAVVQCDSTTRGFLPPRMTTTQKNAISSPAAGLVVYDTTLAKLCVYTTAWETITSI
jgi:hypothetical protein